VPGWGVPSLFLGLGAVSLLLGAVGVGNIMLIGVLECRSEIGLRRALGATKRNIRTQFLAKAVLLSLLGGAAGRRGSDLDRRLRLNQTLDRCRSRERMGGRPRRRHPHRRHRRTPPCDPRRTTLTDRSPPNGVAKPAWSRMVRLHSTRPLRCGIRAG
jgi:hypothetical protein